MATVSARCALEVIAGVIPGNAEPEYTKRFVVTSDEYERQPEIIIDVRDRAFAYAKTIMNPRILNWVRIDWIWF